MEWEKTGKTRTWLRWIANYSSPHMQGEHVDTVWMATLSVFQGFCQVTTESASQEFWHPAVSAVCLGDLSSPGPSLICNALVCGEGRSFMSWAAAWAWGLELKLGPDGATVTWGWVCSRRRARVRAMGRPYWLSRFERRKWIWKMGGEDKTGPGTRSQSKNEESGSRLCRERNWMPRGYSY